MTLDMNMDRVPNRWDGMPVVGGVEIPGAGGSPVTMALVLYREGDDGGEAGDFAVVHAERVTGGGFRVRSQEFRIETIGDALAHCAALAADAYGDN